MPREHLEQAWPVIEPLARLMADRFPDDWPVSETWRRASAGFLGLWLVWDEAANRVTALIGTEIQRTASGKKVLTVMMAAGADADTWADAVESELTAFARANGCAEFKIDGRAGWARRAGDGWQVQRLIAATKKVA